MKTYIENTDALWEKIETGKSTSKIRGKKLKSNSQRIEQIEEETAKIFRRRDS